MITAGVDTNKARSHARRFERSGDHDSDDEIEATGTADADSDDEESRDRPDGSEQPRGPAGYAHLAEFMISTKHSMARRYKKLSLMNLLYLQAEIHHLSAALDKETAADALDRDSVERRYWDYHWLSLATSGSRGAGRRWDLWLDLRKRLYEYCVCKSLLA